MILGEKKAKLETKSKRRPFFRDHYDFRRKIAKSEKKSK